MLPLVIKAASDSAAGSVTAAQAVAGLEARLDSLETAVEAHTTALERWTEAKEAENQILAQQGKDSVEVAKQWHETVRSIFTPQLLIQIVVVLGSAWGIYTSLPQMPSPQPAPPVYDGRTINGPVPVP